MKYHKGGPRLLITDREGALYLERSRIHVEDGRVVYHITDDDQRREYNIPHVNLAVLFMGQGTSITQDAMRLLGEENVHLAVTGTGGSPIHMGGLTTYSGTRNFREMVPIYLDSKLSLRAAKSVMKDRTRRMMNMGAANATRYLKCRDTSGLSRICTTLDEKLRGCDNIPSLLGYEGSFSKSCYGEFRRMSGLNEKSEFRRKPGAIEVISKPAEDQWSMVNRMIDHGNYLCYGMAGAALWALGIPPHMSIFHGKTRSGGLVFDIADSFKDALVLPIAFSLAKNQKNNHIEKKFRARLINSFDDNKILSEAISTIKSLLEAGRIPD